MRVGGGHNQRIGLFDGILIKENHILAAGGVTNVLEQARALNAGVSIQIEVENLEQLEEALSAGAESILLDNFDLESMEKAVKMNDKRALLEVSGGVSDETLRRISMVGVDRVSVGKLTKSVEAVDFSWRIVTVD